MYDCGYITDGMTSILFSTNGARQPNFMQQMCIIIQVQVLD